MTDQNENPTPNANVQAGGPEGTRLAMRGVVLFKVTWSPYRGWTLSSKSRDGYNQKEWGGPSQSDLTVYTNVKALRFEEGSNFPAVDEISCKWAENGEGYEIDGVKSYCVALVAAPPDATVGTMNWWQFRTNQASVRNFGRDTTRAAFTPLRQLLEEGVVKLKPAYGEVDPATPILNLDQFDAPPVPAIAQQWGAKVKPVEFIEATPDQTVRVSRVPAFKAKWKLERFDLSRDQYQGAPKGYPEWEAAKEVVEGLPEILNETEDPEVIDWALNVCLRQLLTYRWNTPKGSLTARNYIKSRLDDIERPERREMVARIVLGPLVRGFEWDTRLQPGELL